MPKAEDTHVVVTLTHHTLHALRAVNGTIEAGGECVLENKASLEALLVAVAPAWKTQGIKADASVWPEGAAWHLSTDTEAMLDRTADAVRAIVSATQKDPRAAMAYAACNAGDGGAVTPDGMDRWIAAGSSRDALARVSETLSGLRVDSDGAGPAAFAAIAAISTALRAAGHGSVALWDLGTDKSSILLVTGAGVEAAVPCDVGLGSIFEAVQAALRLKFRGAGERLFFNEAYDFTEPGPKVGASIGGRLKLALGQFPSASVRPALACIGLTGKQAWFLREVAAAAEMNPWVPETGKLAAELGLAFSDAAVEASFSPASAGLLQILSSRIRSSEAWRPAWVSVEALPEEIAPEPVPVEEPEPAAEPEAAPEPVVRATPAPPPARIRPSLAPEASAAAGPPRPPKATLSPKSFAAPLPPGPASVQRPPISIPTPVDAPATPASPPPAPVPLPAAARQDSPPAPPGAAMKFRTGAPTPDTRPPSFSKPGFQAPEPGDPAAAPLPPSPPPPAPAATAVPAAGAKPPAPVTALPFEVGKLKPAATAAPFTPPPPAQPKNKSGFYIGVAVAAAIVFAVIAVVLDARMEKAKAYDLEQQEALAHHVAEQRLKEAEQSAKEQAERDSKELQAAIEITRKQTQEQTRQEILAEMEAQRLAKLPGTLVIATAPAGASVSIDGGASLISPVRVDAIQPGKHSVQIAMAGREPVGLSADIQGSKTTDLGTIALQTTLGTLQLTSSPDSLDFAVRPAGDPSGRPVRTGRTPAKFDDILHGDYIVTFSRPGCLDHVVKVTVERGGTSPVDTKYLDGSLELSSDPSGAWVEKDGERLGSTPLVIHDLTPKRAQFLLTLPGYDPTPVLCDIPEGQTLKMEAQLLRRDRVFEASEVKTAPVPRETPAPVLSAAQSKMPAEVLLSFVVRLDGSVGDVTVEKASDDDIGRRCKAAVENWRYRAATAADDRLVDSKVEKLFKFPAGSP